MRKPATNPALGEAPSPANAADDAAQADLPLNPATLAPYLPSARFLHITCVETVDSTNRLARSLALSGAGDGHAVLADSQTAGRGRLGRSFHSPAFKGVYLSMLLRPDAAPADAASLTAWTAVAAQDAIEAACGVPVGVKWVNDLVLHNKKVGGILTELVTSADGARVEHIIVGVGVNVNAVAADFPEELLPVATSLALAAGRPVSRARLAAALITRLDALRADWPQKKQRYLDKYRQSCVTLGRQVAFSDGCNVQQATAVAVNNDFSLLVRLPDGQTRNLSSGEVSVRGLFGYV